ncbi:hypothetical protein QQS21_008272 [Conoideocrella luteorostrata]|uniref:D-isomer specific 2-hydroxyacid dehydrogenase NAD-binding domain-containing protein n=1 Tax=Conoideocrella luteorostrata TaxID=1105319 RepID=A0AAJ0CJH4_9HYPO|nr:hypothetical protein QQS21_008272 [Conoideocrella luteorostrata]
MATCDVLLIIVAFIPTKKWVDDLKARVPGIEIHIYPTEMYAQEIPNNVPEDVWFRTTALYTWKAFPTRELAPRLQFVQLHSAGCNQILGNPLYEKSEIAFCTSNGVHPPQITEWVFATFLGFQHHFQEHFENQRKNNWVDPSSDEDVEDAVGLRVGIMGYGSIGRQVARVSKAFGMDVHAYTLHERSTPESRRQNGFTEPGLGDPEGQFPSKWFHGKEQLKDFLTSDLDLLVITLPQTPQTTNLIGKEEFAWLERKKTFLSNVGRGVAVDGEALIAALDAGQIRGAALDVTNPEPLPANSKLWNYKNVVITPHCAGNSNHFNERTLNILSHNLERRAKGLEVVNRVSKSLGY